MKSNDFERDQLNLSVIFLGTAGSIPTPKRNLPAITIRRGNELFFFDCGEGTQRQMFHAKVGFHQNTTIFITHMHGDHVLGLPGLIQTMSLLDRTKKLRIFGPQGIEGFVKAIKQTVQFRLTFPIEVFEIKHAGLITEAKEYELHAIRSDHSIPSYAYAFFEKPRPGKFYPERATSLRIPKGPLWSKLQNGHAIKLSTDRFVNPDEVVGPPRPGRKIVYTGDTRPSKQLIKFAENADLLIHEATFDDELHDRAQDDGHSTPSQAAQIAVNAKVKQLVLTHISARYKESSILLKQASKIFPNVSIAEDFTRIDIQLLKS